MDGSTLSNSRRSGASGASTRVVDVIIPVYSGLAEVRECLESLLSSRSELQGGVIVINDCSPEPAIDEFLRSLERASRITLLENDENLGFVMSCNRAAALRPDNDFQDLKDAVSEFFRVLKSGGKVSINWTPGEDAAYNTLKTKIKLVRVAGGERDMLFEATNSYERIQKTSEFFTLSNESLVFAYD